MARGVAAIAEGKKRGVQKGFKKPHVDWVAAREYYLTHGEVGSSEIAKLFGVSVTSVGLHSKKEGWVQLRKDLQQKANKNIEAKVLEELSEVNTRHAKDWRRAQQLVLANLSIISARTQKLVKDHGNKLEEIPFSEVYKAQSTKFLMEALKEAIAGERTALGLPNNISKSENDLNINNPFSKYTDSELAQMLKANDDQLKSKYAIEGEVTDAQK